MTTVVARQRSNLDLLVWVVRSRLWLRCTDVFPALAAAFLPWSTSAVSIFVGVWFLFFIPTIDIRALAQKFRTPAFFLPLAFFLLAIVGMFWADSTWSERAHGLHPVVKFLVLPYLLYHYSRSQRAHWVFVGFFASCVLLTAVSWCIFFTGWKLETVFPGVPVKNYIDQSQELTLCIFAMAPYLLSALTERQWKRALIVSALMLAMFFNMMFVAVARTALIYIPILAVLFATRYLSPRWMICLCLASVVGVVTLWFASPYLRQRYEFTVRDYKLSRNTNIATSNGERMAYWRTSVESIAEAPVFGHGTGSTKQIFENAARGKKGEWANSVRNPHNQTLYVAIQWGALGVILLYAMWYFHVALFLESGLVAWIGLVVVSQNVISSILNSHLFDFHEGWIYVLGVGVAGGVISSAKGAKLLGAWSDAAARSDG